MAEESLKRLRFFTGRLLTAKDFELEQNYLREKLKRHNRTLHGLGIVSGLKVIVQRGQIVVEPGLALDCEGNELLVVTPVGVSVGNCDWPSAYIQIGFAEECTDVVLKEASTIAEGCELFVTQENSNRGHRHLRARWLACGKPHALAIAKLKQTSQGWRVERGYRAPHIK